MARERGSIATAPGWSRVATLGNLPGPALLVLVGIVYLALAQFVIWLNDPVQLGAGFWPAAGLSLGLLLLLERSKWPWVLAGVGIAEFGGDAIHGYELGGIAFWTAGNVVEPLVGALLVHRFVSPRGALTPLASLVGFVAFGVIAGPLVGGTIGSLGTVVFYDNSPMMVWPKYVVGDALGVLVVAPVLLTWTQRFPARSRVEAAALGVSATVVTLLVFRNWDVIWDVTLPYLILPFLTWAGLRFGVRGVALLGFVVANIANWATAVGYGPFAIAGGTDHAVTLLQLFLGITLTSAFVLAALASDLTDSRELARQEIEHNLEMERNRQFRDAFIGVLSHEIKTPVTTIYGMSHMLRKRSAGIDSDGAREYLADIEAEAERLQRLTEDMLVLSRTEGGRLQVSVSPVALRQLVRRVVDSERARSGGHAFVFDAPEAVPVVLGEEGYVEQVVRNFLSNAVKYSPAGTTIRVTVAPDGGGVAVRVTDEGPGLPSDASDRLFELFYRAPDAISTSPGAGIGLFVCRELVQAMGGRIWATPSPSGGAEFGFWLPAAADEDGGEPAS